MSQDVPPHSSSSGVEDMKGPVETSEPSRVRYGVVAFLAVMTFVLYLDRTCIGQAAPLIQKDLKLSNWDWSIVLNAFALAYALFEIPAGRWGDRFGSRGVLTRIVVWWSIFTAMTGAAGGFVMLVAIRFLFGAGEAGALPNAARVLREWFPDSSRGRAQGLVGASMLLGGAAAPWVSQRLIDQMGWRWTFVIFAMCGVVWSIAFYVWFRDNPAEHPGTNEAERRLIGEGRKTGRRSPSGPTGRSPGNRSRRRPISGCSASSSPCPRGCTSCSRRGIRNTSNPRVGLDPGLSSQLASMVLGAGACATIFGGWFSDWLVRRTGNHRWGRTTQAVVGYGIASLGLTLSVWTDSTRMASFCVAVAAFGVQLSTPAWWACATQISGRHVGALFGLMNMFGSVGRIAANSSIGAFTDWREQLGYSGRAQWDPAFYGFVAVALVGVVLWSLVDPRKVVKDEPSTPDDLL